jgi:putative transposase
VQDPTDLVPPVALWRPRHTLRLRDLAEMLPDRGFIVTHETVRDREARRAPLLAARPRARRRGAAGAKWHAGEPSVRVDGAWCSRYRAIAREGNLVEARPSDKGARGAARRSCARASDCIGRAPAQVTTDGRDATPRASRETLGDGVAHRTSRYKNNRIERDHRGSEQRHHPPRGRGPFASAARPCSACEGRRQYFRAVGQGGERVSPAGRRTRCRVRRAAVMAELAAA